MDDEYKILDIKWIAGFFDGEGCISFNSSFSVRAQITNTNKYILDCIMKTINLGYVRERTEACAKRPKWNTSYDYFTQGYNAVLFLEMIRPFSNVKNKEINLAIEAGYYKANNRRNTPEVIETCKQYKIKLSELKGRK